MGTRTQRSGGAEEEAAGAGACSLDVAQNRLRALCISVRCFPRSLPCPKRRPLAEGDAGRRFCTAASAPGAQRV